MNDEALLKCQIYDFLINNLQIVIEKDLVRKERGFRLNGFNVALVIRDPVSGTFEYLRSEKVTLS